MGTIAKPLWATDYPSYHDMVESWGVEVLLWEVTGDYQGDFVVLVRKAETYGFIMIGYGSCSGCDALEAATPYGGSADWTNVVELSDSLRESVQWAASPQELLDWLDGRDQANSWYVNDSEVKVALDLIRDMLRILATA